jgi:hypothetical protein
MPRGWRDALMRAFGKIPRHCRFCECRFYVRANEKGQPLERLPLS